MAANQADYSETVVKLQKYLFEYGYTGLGGGSNGNSPDGLLGPKTKAAINDLVQKADITDGGAVALFTSRGFSSTDAYVAAILLDGVHSQYARTSPVTNLNTANSASAANLVAGASIEQSVALSANAPLAYNPHIDTMQDIMISDLGYEGIGGKDGKSDGLKGPKTTAAFANLAEKMGGQTIEDYLTAQGVSADRIAAFMAAHEAYVATNPDPLPVEVAAAEPAAEVAGDGQVYAAFADEAEADANKKAAVISPVLPLGLASGVSSFFNAAAPSGGRDVIRVSFVGEPESPGVAVMTERQAGVLSRLSEDGVASDAEVAILEAFLAAQKASGLAGDEDAKIRFDLPPSVNGMQAHVIFSEVLQGASYVPAGEAATSVPADDPRVAQAAPAGMALGRPS